MRTENSGIESKRVKQALRDFSCKTHNTGQATNVVEQDESTIAPPVEVISMY